MAQFSHDQIVHRGLARIATVLHGYWEEGRGAHTRLFDVLIPDRHIYAGTSIPGSDHREHLVPCAILRDTCYAMFGNGASIEDATALLKRNLQVAYIDKSEAQYMDNTLGLKTAMPEGWCPHTGSPSARLEAAGIELTPPSSRPLA